MNEFRAKFIPKDSSDIKSLIQRSMALRGRPEEFIALFHPDAVLHMVGDRRQCRFYGQYRGHVEILGLLRDIDAEFVRREHRLLNAVIDGDSFAIRRLVEIEHRGSSESALVVVGHVAKTQAGLFEEVFEYADTATFVRLLG
jgi:hypothetical protein